MENIVWVLWLLLGVGLIIAEIFTLGFVLFWFGVGAIVAAAVGFVGLGLAWQFATFAAVSIFLTVMSRTIFSRYLPHNDGHAMRSAIDSLPGKIGTVSSSSKGALNEAAVKVFGSTWTAFPVDGESELTEGDKVEVVEVRGSSIYVRPVGKELPGWKQD